MAATQAYPPGGTFLDTIKKSFTDVPMDKGNDNAIATTEFLEAAESLTTLFGMPPSKEVRRRRAGLMNDRCAGQRSLHAGEDRHAGER